MGCFLKGDAQGLCTYSSIDQASYLERRREVWGACILGAGEHACFVLGLV